VGIEFLIEPSSRSLLLTMFRLSPHRVTTAVTSWDNGEQQ
jgi:hypothetical protein